MVKQKKLVRVLSATAVAALLCLSFGASAYATTVTASADDTTYSQQDLYEEGYKLDVEMEEDGAVLFQNNNNALPLGTGVTADLFGYASYNVCHGGGGSGKGKWDADCMQEKAAFEAAGLDVNDELWAWHGSSSGANITQESWVNESSGKLVDGSPYNLPEITADTYKNKGAEQYMNKDHVAIVTFARQGHEGAELPMDMSSNYIDSNLSIRGASDRTYLDPTETELELLQYLKEYGYSKIIVLINSSNVMTINEYLEYSDACLWIGGPGEAGLVGVGEVLVGKDTSGNQISPNGRTADTWMSDFYSNVVFYNNGGSTRYDNVSQYVYNQYEEGIYVGYRWYETAYADQLVLEGANDLDGDGKYLTYDYYNDYDSIVTMPFGGGLSYTTFDWEVVDSNITLTPHGTNSITVKVTNTGDYAAKDTVEIYMNAPYYDGSIDKAEVVLVGFAKTGRLKPNESGQVTITFDTDDLASYDYRGYYADYGESVTSSTDYNGNPQYGGFVLEAGDYEFRIQKDSHNQMTDPIDVTLDETYVYNDATNSGTDLTSTGAAVTTVGARNGDETVAYNKLNDVNATDGSGMIWMQRSTMAEDWDTITNKDSNGNRYRQDQLSSVNMGSDLASGINTATNGTTNVTLTAPYKDSDTAAQIKMTYYYQGATESVYASSNNNRTNYWGKTDDYYADAISNVGNSTTTYTANTRWQKTNGQITENDTVTTGTGSDTYGWDEVPYGDSRWDSWVDQGTWSDMVSLQGTSWSSAFTDWGISAISASDGPGEAGTGGKDGNTWWCSEVVMASTWNPELIERVGAAYGRQCIRTNITSCYGPAMDTHRSPFGGRNFEYYSEDGFLAGMMCVAETAGIQSQGVGTFNKHFMLNDLDGGRSGQMDFCNEQAIREIYIRAWEFSMKSDVAPMSGMMASLNRIGITWANSGLYVGIIREEYGWHGMIISDGMDGVAYSGAVKAAFSGICCLLWSSTVNGSEASSDGYIFTGGTTNASDIASNYGAYMLRETAKSRLWYDTHILCSGTIFTTDYFEMLNSYNYESMDLENLTGTDYDVALNEDIIAANESIGSSNNKALVISLSVVGAVVVVAVVVGVVLGVRHRKKKAGSGAGSSDDDEDDED
ncbi:MAG: glycoside hydrolase family 3 C-terminal domain-containing protein [Clostridia bacterium]|nr:glycoside hydrolase family 3 C-terminal domain-containing protein [Clostridia bacterium]